MVNARLHLRKLVITPQDGKPFLVVEVEITLGDLQLEYQIPGGCVAALAQHLGEIRDQHPELCGQVGEVVDRVDWEGRSTPGKEWMN